MPLTLNGPRWVLGDLHRWRMKISQAPRPEPLRQPLGAVCGSSALTDPLTGPPDTLKPLFPSHAAEARRCRRHTRPLPSTPGAGAHDWYIRSIASAYLAAIGLRWSLIVGVSSAPPGNQSPRTMVNRLICSTRARRALAASIPAWTASTIS